MLGRRAVAMRQWGCKYLLRGLAADCAVWMREAGFRMPACTVSIVHSARTTTGPRFLGRIHAKKRRALLATARFGPWI
jgi:hypothetical protein